MADNQSGEPTEMAEEVNSRQQPAGEQPISGQAGSGMTNEGAGDISDEDKALQRDLTEAQTQLRVAQEQILRAQADLQNIRRRAQRDVESAHKFALEKFAGELLPVVDNLERALTSATTDTEINNGIEEGVRLTLKSFLDVLNKFGIEQVDPHGEPFDPQTHQAMTLIENPNVEPNTVLDVMQKGYVLNGRLLRPAMVVVSRSRPEKTIDEKA